MATTTTHYGFDIPQSTDLVKDGATAIATLGQDIDTAMNTALGTNKAGMVLLNTTSFSGVASQSVNNVFTSTYTNYKVLFRLSAATADTAISLRTRASGTDKSTNYYYGGAQGIFTGTNSTWAGNNVSSWDMGSIDTSNAGIANAYSIDFFSPVPTVTTIINMQCWTQQTSGNTLWVSMSGVQNEQVTCDGFSIISSAGNISGVVRVYGYND